MEGIGVIEKRKSRLGKIRRVCLELAIIAGTAVGGWNIADRTYHSSRRPVKDLLDVVDVAIDVGSLSSYRAQLNRDLKYALISGGIAGASVVGLRIYKKHKDQANYRTLF